VLHRKRPCHLCGAVGSATVSIPSRAAGCTKCCVCAVLGARFGRLCMVLPPCTRPHSTADELLLLLLLLLLRPWLSGDAAAGDGSSTCEVVTSTFIPLIEGAVAEYIAKWQERPAPRGTAQQVCAATHSAQPVIAHAHSNARGS